MELNYTDANLKKLLRKETLEVEDAFNFIYDFCRDFEEETGESLNQKQAKDGDELFRRLPYIFRMVGGAANKNEDLFHEERRRNKLKKIISDTEAFEKKIAVLEKMGQELEERKSQLMETEATLEETKKKEKKLQIECDKISANIIQLQQVDLYEIKRKQQELLQKQKGLSESVNVKQKETENHKNELEELKKTLFGLREEDGKIEQQKESVKRKMRELLQKQDTTKKEEEKAVREREKVEQEILQAEKQIAQIAREMEEKEGLFLQKKKEIQEKTEALQVVETHLLQAKNDCETVRSQYHEKTGMRDYYDKHRGKYRAEMMQLEKEITEIDEETEKLKGHFTVLSHEKENRQSQKNRLYQKVAVADKECRELQSQLAQVEKDLEQKDFTAQKNQLHAILKEKQKTINQFEQKQQELDDLKNQWEQKKQEQLAICQEQQKVRSNAQKELDDLDRQVDELKASQRELEEQKNYLLNAKVDCEARVKRVQTWMKGLDAQRNQKIVENLRERLHLLEKTRRQIEDDWRSQWGKTRVGRKEEMEDILEIMQKDLQTMEGRLNGYQESLMDIIRCLSSKDLKE